MKKEKQWLIFVKCFCQIANLKQAEKLKTAWYFYIFMSYQTFEKDETIYGINNAYNNFPLFSFNIEICR